MPETKSAPALVVQEKVSGTLLVQLSGDWRVPEGRPGTQEIERPIAAHGAVKALEFDASGLTGWDSWLVAFIAKCQELCRARGLEFSAEGLPDGVRGLLRLATAVPEAKDTRRNDEAPPNFLHSVGKSALDNLDGTLGLFTFLGANVLAMGRLFRGRAQFRWPDAFLVMQECGPQAMGIVALINFLIGMILAFVGATSLEQFGATVYVADMVAIGTVREMGAIMTGIIVCGRTGAAFAAQLGTMKVNEEINALQTFGISPIEFLVLPRMIALILMMPILVVFADLISIFGGFVVSLTLLDGTATEYILRTVEAIRVNTFLLGIFKGAFFGFLIAYTGCLRGMQCGSNAAAVGLATTRAVVAGITAIIASDGIFAVICNALGI